MIIKIACEGNTEKGLIALLRRIAPSGVHVEGRPFDGVNDLLDNIEELADNSFAEGTEYIFCLLDLPKVNNFPQVLLEQFKKDFIGKGKVREEVLVAKWTDLDIPIREDWLRRNLAATVLTNLDLERVTIHFAVHEVEAWMFADPETIKNILKVELPDGLNEPEEIDDKKPPSKILKDIAKEGSRRGYIKPVHGRKILANLNYELVMGKCPHFRELINEFRTITGQN